MTASAMDVSSVRDKVSDKEWQVRVDLAALYRLVAKYGMDDLVGTHLSARVPSEEGHFLLNPYGLLFDEVTASSLVKIDMDGNVVLDGGYKVNPAGFTIHSAVLGGRADIGCVAHTHTVAGMAVSALKDGLLPVTQHAMRFYNRTSYHDWEGLATNLDEREGLVRDLGPTNLVMILRNHGLLACGESVSEAWKVLYQLEKSCASQLEAMAAARAAGVELIIPADDVCEYVATQFEKNRGPDRFDRDWPFLLRDLDAEDASYKH